MSRYTALCIATLLAVATANCLEAKGTYDTACASGTSCDDFKSGACGNAYSAVAAACTSSTDKLQFDSVKAVVGAVCDSDATQICEPETSNYNNACKPAQWCSDYTGDGACKNAVEALRTRATNARNDDFGVCESIAKVVDKTVKLSCGEGDDYESIMAIVEARMKQQTGSGGSGDSAGSGGSGSGGSGSGDSGSGGSGSGDSGSGGSVSVSGGSGGSGVSANVNGDRANNLGDGVVCANAAFAITLVAIAAAF